MEANKTAIKNRIIEVLNELPAEKMVEILDFAAFVRQDIQSRTGATRRLVIKKVPIAQLRSLTGIITWGGDAVADSERLYE
jgi:hypothetical protein